MARHAETLEINTELAAIPGASLKVSSVAIGTWAVSGWMWGGTDEAESDSTIRATNTRPLLMSQCNRSFQ